jgi:hypothetical protein
LSKMIPVALAGGVTIHCPEDGRFAFFNSPYPAHRLSTGVDVYSGGGFGDAVPSPVGGEVTLIRRVRSPKGRSFRDPGYDVVTLIGDPVDPETVVKILHVEPTVEVGDTLEPGEELGTLLRSGYFGYSTQPHAHLEVRRASDPLRVRGGYPIRRLVNMGRLEPVDEIRGVVAKRLPGHAVLRLEGARYGLIGDIGGVHGVLDGGIPYYGWVGAHFEGTPKGGSIKLCGEPIAKIKEARGGTCTAECGAFVLGIDGVPVGLSLYFQPVSEPEIIVIPLGAPELPVEESSEVVLSVGPTES